MVVLGPPFFLLIYGNLKAIGFYFFSILLKYSFTMKFSFFRLFFSFLFFLFLLVLQSGCQQEAAIENRGKTIARWIADERDSYSILDSALRLTGLIH